MSRRFAFVVAIAFSALVVTSGSSAAPSELFFSEYIEGSSNNKALEIYNGTGAPIDLTAGGLRRPDVLQRLGDRRADDQLAGTVAAGDVYVLAHSSASATILAQADQTNGAGWFNGDDAVVLRKGRRRDVIDVDRPGRHRPWHGVGHRAGEHGRQHAPAQGGSRGRRPHGSNAFDPSLEWDGFATDDARGLGAHRSDAAPSVATHRTPAGGSSSPNGSVTVTFSEPVNVTGRWFTISCATSGNHTATVVRRPDDLHARPGRRLRRRRRCTVTVDARAGHRPGRDRSARQHGGELRLQLHGRRRLRAAPVHADLRDPGQRPRAPRSPATSRRRASSSATSRADGRGLQGFYIQDADGRRRRRDVRRHLRLHRQTPTP